MSRICDYCRSTEHTSFYCRKKPRKRIARSSKPLKRPTKPISRFGKYTKQWMVTRNQWFRENPPDEIGAYYCYLCGRHLFPNQTQLDHVKSRSRHPELRFVQSNLRPVCHACNVRKGSKDIEEL